MIGWYRIDIWLKMISISYVQTFMMHMNLQLIWDLYSHFPYYIHVGCEKEPLNCHVQGPYQSLTPIWGQWWCKLWERCRLCCHACFLREINGWDLNVYFSTGKVCGRGSITQSTLKIGSPAWLRDMKVLSEIPIWISLMLLFGQGVYMVEQISQSLTTSFKLFFSKPWAWKWSQWSLWSFTFSGQQNFLKLWSYI